MARISKERDEERQQHKQLEDDIGKTCSDIIDIKVFAEEAPTEKVVKLSLTINDSKNNMENMKFEYQMYITELQTRLQPTTPSEVWE